MQTRPQTQTPQPIQTAAPEQSQNTNPQNYNSETDENPPPPPPPNIQNQFADASNYDPSKGSDSKSRNRFKETLNSIFGDVF
jgi:hypothetical protein